MEQASQQLADIAEGLLEDDEQHPNERSLFEAYQEMVDAELALAEARNDLRREIGKTRNA